MPTRVPRVIPEFNAYIGLTDDYLQAPSASDPLMLNWQRLGLLQADADQWHAMRGHWDNDLYAKYNNPATKTKTVNALVAEYLDTFRHFAQPLLGRMAANPIATKTDEAVFNFKKGRSKPSRRYTPITDKCVLYLKNLGGGMIRFGCRTMHENGPPALPPGADSIILAYKIGGEPPAHAEDGTKWEFISRARGIRNLGVENRGQRIYLFARWYNKHYPHFAGPWSTMVMEWV